MQEKSGIQVALERLKELKPSPVRRSLDQEFERLAEIGDFLSQFNDETLLKGDNAYLQGYGAGICYAVEEIESTFDQLIKAMAERIRAQEVNSSAD